MNNLNFEDEEHCSATDNPEWPNPWSDADKNAEPWPFETPQGCNNILQLPIVTEPAKSRSSSDVRVSEQPISTRLRRSGPAPSPTKNHVRPSSQTSTSASSIAGPLIIPQKRGATQQSLKPGRQSMPANKPPSLKSEGGDCSSSDTNNLRVIRLAKPQSSGAGLQS